MAHKTSGVRGEKERDTLFGSGGAGGVETTAGGQAVLHEVGEVYVYIPPELSAAGVELKIVGSVRVINKSDLFHLTWSPADLTQQDVASLYLAQADGWTMVDQFVEPPEVIEARELSYPDTQYSVGNLEAPDPILMSPKRQAEGNPPMTSPLRNAKQAEAAEEAKVTGTGVHFSRDGEAHISGMVSQRHTHTPSSNSGRSKVDTVNFPLSELHSIKESAVPQSPGKRSLTFFLLDGSELPTLYFHDGGILGLLNALQRFVYLVRDRRNDKLYLVKEFDKTKRETPHTLSSSRQDKKGAVVGDIVTGVIGGAMGNIIGITRAVRQHLIPDHKLQDVRPGTEEDDEFDEKIQTVAMSEAGPPYAGSEGRRGVGVVGGGGAGRQESKEVDPDMSLITDFQIITDIRGKLPPRLPAIPMQAPLSVAEWESFRDGEGRIGREKEKTFRARVFAGGMEPSLRKEAWRYLLNYFPFDSSDIDRMELQKRKEKEYWSMKSQWQRFTPDQERRFSKWREVKTLINKDVLRTDRDVEMFSDKDSHRLTQLEDVLRTYVMYNFDLGYVQGMSDLLAPLLSVMENEVDTFWCFAGFMEMVGHHFEVSQMGMRNRLKQLRAVLNVSDPKFYQFLKLKECNNLYFCFRWLLIHFKREFDYPVLLRLWEVIWTNYLSPDYSLFIALAILETEKEKLFNPAHDFSDILQHINGLAKSIPLESTLQLAEVLCRQLGACRDLPDDLKCLVVKPAPRRLTSIVQMETIVCNPEGSAVPSGDCAAPSGDSSSSSTNRAYPSANRPVLSKDVGPSQNRALDDSLQSTGSDNSLVV